MLKINVIDNEAGLKDYSNIETVKAGKRKVYIHIMDGLYYRLYLNKKDLNNPDKGIDLAEYFAIKSENKDDDTSETSSELLWKVHKLEILQALKKVN